MCPIQSEPNNINTVNVYCAVCMFQCVSLYAQAQQVFSVIDEENYLLRRRLGLLNRLDARVNLSRIWPIDALLGPALLDKLKNVARGALGADALAIKDLIHHFLLVEDVLRL